MASSGRMTGNSLTISGYGNQYYFVDWQLASQNQGANTSTINWQNYFHFNLADAQLDNGDVVAGGATRYDVPGRVYNYSGNFTTRDLAISSGSFTVTHNPDGTYTLSVSGAIDVFSTGTSSGSASWALPTIPRFATITGRTPSTTDIGISVAVTTDVTCDMVYLSIDNGATYPYTASGDFTSTTISTTGSLPSDTTYNCYVAVKRKDSQQLTYSTPFTATTASQNNFMGFL